MRLRYTAIILLCIICFLYKAQSQQCSVTQTVKFDDCVLYCWNTYNGSKDFYDLSTGNCQPKVTCGAGYYLDSQNNICMDQFGGYILKDLGYVFKVKQQQVMRFVQIIVLQGYTAGNTLICNDGWISSMKTQIKSNISIIVYLCDQQLKDGQIYPMTHGEYFFDTLTLQQQVYVMDTVLGTDDLITFFTLKVIAFIVFTALYVFLNCMACCASIKNKKCCRCFTCCCCKKNASHQNPKLTDDQNKEIEQFLQKRKQQRLQKMKDLKWFSLKDQFHQQLQVLKNIKFSREQSQKKRWLKKYYQQKQKAKLQTAITSNKKQIQKIKIKVKFKNTNKQTVQHKNMLSQKVTKQVNKKQTENVKKQIKSNQNNKNQPDTKKIDKTNIKK